MGAVEELLHAEIVYTCPIFKVEEATVRLPDGRTEKRWYVLKPPGVGVLPIDDEGRLLLTREYLSAAGKTVWRVVMGTVEEGETPLQAARREMREEIGLDAEAFETLFEATHPSGFIKHKGTFFLARGLFASPLECDEFEQIEVVPSTATDVQRLIDAGEFQGNFTKIMRLALGFLEPEK